MEEQEYEVSKLDLAVGLFSRNATAEVSGLVRTTSLRIPLTEFAQIDALAQHSGVSRNKVICTLLDLALPDVLANLPKVDAKSIDKLSVKLLQKLMQESDNEQAAKGEC